MASNKNKKMIKAAKKRLANNPAMCSNSEGNGKHPLESVLGYRQVQLEIAGNMTKRRAPTNHNGDSDKGLYEYVKPKFGSIRKQKRFNVYDLS